MDEGLMNLQITEYQKWIIVRALYLLTSNEGLEKLQKDFPMMNIEQFADETKGLMKVLGVLKDEN